MRYAMIIIDMLNDFFEKDSRLNKLKKTLCKNSNDLIRFARKKKIPVIFIRQEFKPDLSDAFLFMKQKKSRLRLKAQKDAKFLKN